MAKRMIWVEDECFTGWCCSQCPWGVIAPRLESTVAALAFNRVAQEGFDKHDCTGSTQRDTRI
jgi:hypothetical protein